MCSLLNLRGKYIYALHNLTDNSFASAASLPFARDNLVETRGEKRKQKKSV